MTDPNPALSSDAFQPGAPPSGVQPVGPTKRPAARASRPPRGSDRPRPPQLASSAPPPTSTIAIGQGRHGTLPQTIHAAVLGATGAQLSYLRALATVHRVKYVEEADLASARERVYSLLVISGAGWPAHVESLIALRPQLRWPALVTGHGDSSPSPLTLCHADAVCCPTPDARAIDTLALRSSQLLISDEDMRARWMQHEIIPAVSSRLHVSHAVAEVVVRHGYLGQSQGEIAAEMGITRRTVQRHQQYAVGVMGVETLKLVWLRASGRSHRDTLR